jgi:hypothetical protein
MAQITNSLIEAYRVTTVARAELAAVAWAEVPGVLRALGQELSPEDAATVAAGIAEPSPARGQASARRLLAVRGILALAGDRAARAADHGDVVGVHPSIQAAHEMCVELVGLLGGALALADVAHRVAAKVEVVS